MGEDTWNDVQENQSISSYSFWFQPAPHSILSITWSIIVYIFIKFFLHFWDFTSEFLPIANCHGSIASPRKSGFEMKVLIGSNLHPFKWHYIHKVVGGKQHFFGALVLWLLILWSLFNNSHRMICEAEMKQRLRSNPKARRQISNCFAHISCLLKSLVRFIVWRGIQLSLDVHVNVLSFELNLDPDYKFRKNITVLWNPEHRNQ